MGETYGVPYNGFSIMQYERRAFSTNGKNTMESKRPDLFTTEQMGTNNWMTLDDVSKLRQMYGCDDLMNSVCEDKDETCPTLADSKGCSQFKVEDLDHMTYMQENCRNTCQFCPANCKDTYGLVYCKWIKDWGYCDTLDVMSMICRKTCNFCQSSQGV